MSRFLLSLLLAGLALPGFAASNLNPEYYNDGAAPPQYFAIGRMPKPPALDGTLTGWPADAATFLMGQNTQNGRRLNWQGTKDCSGQIWLAWDEHYLYLAADIVDDKLCQATTPAEIWQGDTLELFFSTHPRLQRVDGYWQEAIVPPLVPGAVLKAIGPQKNFTGVEGTAKVHPGGYTLECRIPWRNLDGFSPSLGDSLGFQLFVDDRDGQGRKSQLYWYASALSFSRPSHHNILVFRDRGDTASPRVLAGPADWAVSAPDKMGVSAITSVADAKSATVTMIPPYPDGAPSAAPAPVTFDLTKTGERASIGQGTFPVTGLAGLYNFKVEVADSTGQTVAENEFQTELVGANYKKMIGYMQDFAKRIPADKLKPGLDPEALAGLNFWYLRLGGFWGNECHASSLTRSLLDKMVVEGAALEGALDELEAGKDPYAGRTGSFVRAYKSPLTGGYQSCALYVPADYDPSKKYPLIVILHSIFADDRMLTLLDDNFPSNVIVVQGPSYRQFDWGGVSAAETWVGLDDVKKLYSIDADRMYLAGYHIGGRGTWQLAEARPDQWAAIAPIFSGIDTGPHYPALRLYPQYYTDAIDVRIPPPQYKAPPPPEPITDPLEKKMYEQDSLATRIDNIAALPMRSAYGEGQPDNRAERMAMQDRLTQLGYPLATRYVPGAMHGSPAEEFYDPAFYRWLISFKRADYPKKLTFVATDLRDNKAWWVSVDQLASPEDTARIEASLDGAQLTVKTSGASAISLLADDRLASAGTSLTVQIDGQSLSSLTAAAGAAWTSYVRGVDGKWAAGTVPDGQKKPGLAGPIDDFQRDRFIVVYGTGGDAAAQKVEQAHGQQVANWGLGATFDLKADTELTDDDVHHATLILIGTPSNNSQLAKIAAQLPLKWSATGLQLGKKSVEGPGAGACFIVPNPLATGHYVVVVTGTDDAGYGIWNLRDPGGDYVLGHAETVDGKPRFVATARGWFDNDWKWSSDLCLKPGK